MQHKDVRHAFHDAPPGELPLSGWRRVEIHELWEVVGLAKQLETEMKSLDFPRKDSFAVALVLCEAAANAIRHGHACDKSRTVLINFHVGTAAVFLEVADEGLGFDPYRVADVFDQAREGQHQPGRGLLLMRVYTSWIRFNKRGNRVTLCKRRSSR